MKILIVANYTEGIGGISGVIANHIKKLREEQIPVELFNTRVGFIKRLLLIIPLIKRVKKHEVIHIHACSYWGFFPAVIGIIASKILLNRRTILTYHGGGADDFLKKKISWIRFLLKKADAITVMSGYLEQIFSKYQIETVILPNLTEVEMNKNIVNDYSSPKLISVRSHEPIYNIKDIVDAFILVKEKYDNAELKIVGKGSLTNDIVNYCLEKKIKNIEFVGAVKSEEVPKLLKQSNIFVSVPSFDNQPMSLLEAFASGIPVISSNVGGVPYMVTHGISGFLVELHHPEQICKQVDWIMQHSVETDAVTRKAQESIVSYQWSSIRKILFNLYKNSESCL